MRKRIKAVVIGLASSIAVAAFGYFTGTVTWEGNTNSAKAGKGTPATLEITGATIGEGVTPGTTVPLEKATLQNPSPSREQHYSRLTATVETTEPCKASWFTVEGTNTEGKALLAGSGSQAISAGLPSAPLAGSYVLKMAEEAGTNQAACEGSAIKVHLKVQ